MKQLSPRFQVFCWIGLITFIIVQQFRLLHYGPNDIGAGNFTSNVVCTKYGFPPPSNYIGSTSRPVIKFRWHIVSYKEDLDKKGGTYAVGFLHITQDGPSITKIQGQLTCRYDAVQKTFSTLDFQASR